MGCRWCGCVVLVGYGLSRLEDALRLSPFIPRTGRRGEFPFVAARGTMFCLCLPAFPFVGDAPVVGGHDIF